ncbi:uncharacterized protein LOC121386430 [Gigantopelta aegis]|uniref:uncharacterized protein LOC121386430 n=1 Tax=Gigantopelta aegis TaxID=1735272 RepID=UPI001B88825D|nr:uncharacterized protein LOC121386430 [Gigantopelta aegis]
MASSKLCVIFAVILIASHAFGSPALYMHGTRRFSKVNQAYLLKCDIYNSKTVYGDVSFLRRHGRNTETMVTIRQGQSLCSISYEKKPNKYIPHCGQGTLDMSSEIKSYTLAITRLGPDDFTSWWCSFYLRPRGIYIDSGKFNVREHRLLIEISAVPFTALLTQKVTLKCMVLVANDLTDEIVFMKVSGQTDVTVGQVAQYSQHCGNVRGTRGYQPSCGHGSNRKTSKVKAYTLEIESVGEDDFTDWWCQTRVVRADHDIFTLRRTTTGPRMLMYARPMRKYSKVYQEYWLKCDLHKAKMVYGEVSFLRRTGRNVSTMGTIEQGRSGCSVSYQKEGYRYFPQCGSGTFLSSIDLKQYTLCIRSLSSEDFTNWWCTFYHRPKGMYIHSNNVNVIEQVVLMELSAEPATALLEQKVTLTCTVNQANDFAADVIFVKVSNQTDVTVGHIIQYSDLCGNVDGTRGYRPSCGRRSNTKNSMTKVYTLEIESVEEEDFTDWWCQTRVVRADHDIFTLKRTATAQRPSFKTSSGSALRSRANQHAASSSNTSSPQFHTTVLHKSSSQFPASSSNRILSAILNQPHSLNSGPNTPSSSNRSPSPSSNRSPSPSSNRSPSPSPIPKSNRSPFLSPTPISNISPSQGPRLSSKRNAFPSPTTSSKRSPSESLAPSSVGVPMPVSGSKHRFNGEMTTGIISAIAITTLIAAAFIAAWTANTRKENKREEEQIIEMDKQEKGELNRLN